MSIAVVLVAVVAAAVTIAVTSRKWKSWQAIEKLPGKMAFPFIGTTYLLFLRKREEMFDVIEEHVKLFWPIFRTWLGMKPEIHILTPEHVEKIMTSNELISKAESYRFLHPWLGDGLLTSTGPKWHARRKMITPAFHFKILDNFVEVFAEKSEILIDLLKSKANGQSFNIYPYITRCALDIICETAMGTSVNAQTGSQSEYVSAVYSISELTIKRSFSPWLYNDFVFRRSGMGKKFYKDLDILQGFTRKVIMEKKMERNSKGSQLQSTKSDEYGRKRRVAFLDLLLEASESSSSGQKLADREIQEEVDTFMFEGHDTTSVAMSWVLVLLGQHPDVQEKVFAELNDIFKANPGRRPTMKDLTNMRYLEMVIKEALRLCPSVPFIGRETTQEVEVAGYKIPKGTTLMLHIRQIHRDPNHWKNPECFDPDNFLPERIQKRHPFAYVPFSAGPRNCIGQKFAILEEKTVLSYLLRNYSVQTVERMEDMKLVGELVLRPINGVLVRLTPR